MNLKIETQSDKVKVIEEIHRLSLEKKWTVKIEVKKVIRSISQNRLYWLWVACISHETGNSKDMIHQTLGMMFLPRVIGKLGVEPVSTTILDTVQFKKYLDEVNLWANEFLGITLPNPDDLHFSEFYEKYKDLI